MAPLLKVIFILFSALICCHSLAIDNPELEQIASSSNRLMAKSPIVDAPVYPGENQIIENTWTGGLKRALNGPTGQMVVNIAKEVIARQVGGTQVLSLNLTNLLILLFLKAIIFAAGLIGAGSWGQYARSLDADNRPVLDFSDASMMLGFLVAQGSGKNDDCLFQAACEYPDAALEYIQAGHAMKIGVEMFNRTPTDPQYEFLLAGMEKAAKAGIKGAQCDRLYHCPL